MFKRSVALFALLFAADTALAQSVQQSGPVTPNTAAIWNSTGVIRGGVTATDSPLTTFGVTRDAVDALCVSSARQTAVGRNQLCLQAATNGPGKISLQNYGTATPQDLQFVVNGTAVTIPTGGGSFLLNTGGQTTGHMPCFTAVANVLRDCDIGIGPGTQWGVPYYSDSATLTSTGAAGAGQFLLGQGGTAPLWSTLTGDVQTVSSGGAVTLNKVNGIPFSTSYTAHGVLLGEGSSAFTSLTTASVGQCLLSQGTSADPIWSSCAAGTGSAGGSNTQVQYNNSTSLGGSANLTWVSPALTIGVAGTTTGQLALASSTATGTVTLQAAGVSGTYNFNFPTGAGSAGQPMLSGGGGSTPNTFGTLGVFGGGTNCVIASGTCLDNITGFSSTGFIFRSGAGTYTFSNPVPVGNGGTGLISGTSGGVLAYSGAGTIASSGVLTTFTLVVGGGAGGVPSVISKGTAGQILVDQTGANPSWNTMSGDATLNSSGALTIANSAVTVAKMANAAGYSLIGNFTGSSAAPQVSTIGALTQKASPAASDLVLIQDQAASGQLKYAQVSAIASAGSVSSIAGNTGAFTLNGTTGLTNSTNDIQCSQGSSAQFGCVKVDNTSMKATAGVISQAVAGVTQSATLGPTGTTSASAKMMGLGTSCAITPSYATRVRVNFVGYLTAGAQLTGVTQVKYGTGTAPANGAADTGTQVGSTVDGTVAVAGYTVPFSNGGIVTGLSAGTAYWFDINLATGGGSTVTAASVTCSIQEL